MGVPAFFRWLSRKYPSIVHHCVEEKPKVVDGIKVPVDCTLPNPNDVEFDNLYLDMNGIIHPCCHPENKKAPETEDEMMTDIFDYIDRLMSICRPRRLLYMAIDGVAPRAKMNQQRSRRFRAIKDSEEKELEVMKIREALEAQGLSVPPKKEGSRFDHNCITPGTHFMHRLSECLRYYVYQKMNQDPAWQKIHVVLSDANAPGEGEHKIMDFIRRQRAQPGHDPNTHHCLCGADADLIMLGLATHEPHFTIIREEFKPNKPRPCDVCGQYGHEMSECTGSERNPEDEEAPVPDSEETFIFIRLSVLREYLEREMAVLSSVKFGYDFERVVDDWVFMCFFVGNDFLPHLPSLEIREGAIDRLVRYYKSAVTKVGGYLTENGYVNLGRVQVVLDELSGAEDEIFKKRREQEIIFRHRKKRQRKYDNQRQRSRGRGLPQGSVCTIPGAIPFWEPEPLGPAVRKDQERYQFLDKKSIQSARVQGYRAFSTNANQQAALDLKNSFRPAGSGAGAGPSTGHQRSQSAGFGHQSTMKRKTEEQNRFDSDDEQLDRNDDVRLWEHGFKDRYYENKFGVEAKDHKFRHKIAWHYARGLCWVLLYYYQGCPSWKWYFPYHYAPFASDFVDLKDIPNTFDEPTEPFKPLEQLMGVFPAGSKKFLPPSWQLLMTEADSSIIDFYPTDFKVDLNGKKFAWQGVALLPFVEELRLRAALKEVYPDLTEDEQMRNSRGSDVLFMSRHADSFTFSLTVYDEWLDKKDSLTLDNRLTQGLSGQIWSDKSVTMPSDIVKTPLPDRTDDIHENICISVEYIDPQYSSDYVFQAKLLTEGLKEPMRVLKPEGMSDNTPYRPVLGFTKNSGYRDPVKKDVSAMLRMIRHEGGSGAPSPRQQQSAYMADHHRNQDERHGRTRSDPSRRGPGSGWSNPDRGRFSERYPPTQFQRGAWWSQPSEYTNMMPGLGGGPMRGPPPGNRGRYNPYPQQQQRQGGRGRWNNPNW